MNNPQTISCAIVDDEPLAIRLIQSFVERTPFLTLAASFSDSVEALRSLRNQPVDLLFLDIQMPDVDGMELARQLPAATRIVFTTAFRDFAFDSYEVNALDFLLKPIRYTKFLAAAEKAQAWFAMQRVAQANAVVQVDAVPPSSLMPTGVGPTDSDTAQWIFLRVDGELRRVDFHRILYVEGMKDYVMFYLEGERRPLITHLTMKAVEQSLPTPRFMRVNRSYVVALDKVRTIDRNLCLYIGDEVIRVTDMYKEQFETYLKNRLP